MTTTKQCVKYRRRTPLSKLATVQANFLLSFAPPLWNSKPHFFGENTTPLSPLIAGTIRNPLCFPLKIPNCVPCSIAEHCLWSLLFLTNNCVPGLHYYLISYTILLKGWIICYLMPWFIHFIWVMYILQLVNIKFQKVIRYWLSFCFASLKAVWQELMYEMEFEMVLNLDLKILQQNYTRINS